MSLSLFPVRVPIGVTTDASGKTLQILMTPEFARALSDLYDRVGGDSGIGTDELALFSSFQSAPETAAMEAAEEQALSQDAGQVACIAVLAQQVADLQIAADQIQAATIAALTARVEELSLQVAALGDVSSALGTLAQQMDGLQLSAFVPTYRVAWDRPDAIGALAPNTGKFTTLTAGGGATLMATSAALANGAAAAAGTLLTAPVAGNPTKWIGINDNGTIRYVPAW